MKIAEMNITNEEAAQRWKNGDCVFTVELGGLGPSYEQTMQEFAWDYFCRIVPLKLKVDEKEKFDVVADEVAKGRDLSGAQYHMGRSMAQNFYLNGYAETIRTFWEKTCNWCKHSRIIQVNKIKRRG